MGHWWKAWFLVMLEVFLAKESLTVCGVNDSFVGPENLDKAFKLLITTSPRWVHKYHCEGMGQGEIHLL